MVASRIETRAVIKVMAIVVVAIGVAVLLNHVIVEVKTTIRWLCASIFLALALDFGELGVTTRALAAVAFVFLTAPLAAHAIGRAAIALGVPLFPGTKVNEMPPPSAGGADGPGPSA